MKKDTVIDSRFIGYTTVAVLMGMGFAAAVGVSAQNNAGQFTKRPIDGDHRETVSAALEEGDYEAFVALLEEVRPRTVVTEEGFDALRERHKERQAHHEEMEAILTSGDYGAWVAFMETKPRITEVITEDNFDRFVAMHEARKDGDVDTFHEIRDELGLPLGKQWHHAHHGRHKGSWN